MLLRSSDGEHWWSDTLPVPVMVARMRSNRVAFEAKPSCPRDRTFRGGMEGMQSEDMKGRSPIRRLTMGTDPMDELEIRLNELRSYGLFAPSAIRQEKRGIRKAMRMIRRERKRKKRRGKRDK